MFARVRFGGTAREALTIPQDAITRRGQVSTVFVVEDGVARMRLVQTGATEQGRVEILAGLDAGETVVISPPPALVDGQAVKATGTGAVGAPGAAAGDAR
jgi:hypothetical protein